VTDPGRNASTMGRGGVLLLLEEFGFHQHGDRLHRGRKGLINGPALRLSEPPLHYKAKDSRAFAVEDYSQLL
jgi:hypothetical protein